MFAELPVAWDSKISLGSAILSAAGWGFNAGLAFGILFMSVFRFRTGALAIGMLSVYLGLSLAAAIRFYFLAMTRVQERISLRRT